VYRNYNADASSAQTTAESKIDVAGGSASAAKPDEARQQANPDRSPAAADGLGQKRDHASEALRQPSPGTGAGASAPQVEAVPEQALRQIPGENNTPDQTALQRKGRREQQTFPGAGAMTQVEFNSDPMGAQVTVDRDGSKTCTTPCRLPLAPGRHTLTITAVNYGMAHRIIQVPDQHDVFVPLVQNVGIVELDSVPSGSAVYVDGRLLGQTPTTVKLTAGAHQIRLVSGPRSHQETVQVSANSLQQFTFRWQ
jgi:hypothetical protein